MLRPQDIGPGEGPLVVARILGTAGFISGAGFAVMLAFPERGRTIRDVSLRRVALWGVAGGAIVPLLTSAADSQVVWTSPLGGVLATAMVAIARRSEGRTDNIAGPPSPWR